MQSRHVECVWCVCMRVCMWGRHAHNSRRWHLLKKLWLLLLYISSQWHFRIWTSICSSSQLYCVSVIIKRLFRICRGDAISNTFSIYIYMHFSVHFSSGLLQICGAIAKCSIFCSFFATACSCCLTKRQEEFFLPAFSILCAPFPIFFQLSTIFIGVITGSNVATVHIYSYVCF